VSTTIFKCTDDLGNMLQCLEEDGLIGVSGSRISVRNLLEELISAINRDQADSEERYMSLTYNHPDTELGYAWDTTRFPSSAAKRIVLAAYK
jgi:hypothetical protein